MQDIEEIRERSEESNDDSKIQICGHTRGSSDAFDWREEEEERIDVKSNETPEEEDSVPLKHNVTTRIKNLVSLDLEILREDFESPESREFETEKTSFAALFGDY